MTYDVDKNKKDLDKHDSQESDYYGQWETDRIIEEYFPGQKSGSCIEVGAANGVKGSNTAYFEDLEWDVLCIEPNIGHKKSLEATREHVRYFAVSNYSGEAELTVFDVGERNIMSSLTSLVPDKRLVDAHSNLINKTHQLLVNVRTLPWILQNETKNTPFEGKKNIDFISVDTEGTELDVLTGFDFDMYNVTLFVIENNFEDPEIEEFMNTKGYVKNQRYKINDFYVKEE